MPSKASGFNILYCGDVREDVISLAEYIEEFYLSVGKAPVDIQVNKLFGVVGSMIQQFPSPIGSEQASPFKKVGAFTTYFVAERPIITHLPDDKFKELASHQNAIIAFCLSIDALHRATIKQPGKEVILENRIAVSTHFWKDTIAALSNTMPLHHFECVSLLYESLAYQVNPSASYERVI